MKSRSDLLRILKSEEGIARISALYGTRSGVAARQLERYMLLVKKHEDLFGNGTAPRIISAPGRTELCGNHTDHNNGLVMAAAVDLDTVAAVSPRDDLKVNLHSEGFAPVSLDLGEEGPMPDEQGTPASLIRGIARRMREKGIQIRGFDACVTSDVRTGSGLSSSAAFEVMIVTVFDTLYGECNIDPLERAVISQYAENEYFGKPCGLMDQMACSVGGLVAIDFKDEPKATSLIVVNTGGSHDDLTAEYAAIRQEMNAVAACFGEKTLRGVRPEQLWHELPMIREKAGDRAALRAMHYYAENERVKRLVKAVQAGDTQEFRRILIESGRSSWMYLQNVYAHNDAQPLCVAQGIAEHLLAECGAWRVHGGGFAGTTLNLVPHDQEERFLRHMRRAFGENACSVLSVRSTGAVAVF